MKMRLLIAALAGVLTALAFGAFALADEALAPGDYEITLPGVGTITVAVADTGTVDVVTVPDGYTVVPDDDEGEAEFRLVDSDGVAALKIEVEEGELKVKVDGLTSGEHSVTIPDVGQVTIQVNDDGTFEVTQIPEGWTFETKTEDGETKVKLVSEDGALEVKLEIEDGTLTFKVEAEEADDEIDAADHDDDDAVHEDDDDAVHEDDDSADQNDDHDSKKSSSDHEKSHDDDGGSQENDD